MIRAESATADRHAKGRGRESQRGVRNERSQGLAERVEDSVGSAWMAEPSGRAETSARAPSPSRSANSADDECHESMIESLRP